MTAVAESARNVAVSGARPRAFTNCLNFGNPEKPDIMWQFVEAVEGMAEAGKTLETPVVSGNVSLYNETEGKGVYPTPTIVMVGVIDDVEKAVTSTFKLEGSSIYLLGENTDEIGGSEYLSTIHGIEKGMPPKIDLEKREEAYQSSCGSGGKRAYALSARYSRRRPCRCPCRNVLRREADRRESEP
ncbi:MAG: AIR synthase related protein [Geovibrio sp.]|nr:AIR synthase related protein [Geovibrio sp.]